MSTNQTFKAFKGGKSKARKGLERAYPVLAEHADTLLVQVDGEHGFYIEAADALIAALEANNSAIDSGKEPADLPTGSESDAGAASDDDQPEDDLPAAPVASGNMFGGIAATLGTVAVTKPEPAARTGATRSNYTIEKDRPEQNGIKRPSAGGLCRAVWDKMDEIRAASGSVPTTTQVRSAAEVEGWNPNNAMIEFYQWRRYNGIVGRAAKVGTTTVNEAGVVVANQSEPADPALNRARVARSEDRSSRAEDQSAEATA